MNTSLTSTSPHSNHAGVKRRDFLRTAGAGISAASALGVSLAQPAHGTQATPPVLPVSNADNFYQSEQVQIQAVRFPTQYGLQIAGNLVTPKQLDPGTPAPAIVVGHPMGAVKEQSAMLYAQKLAEQGFVTLAIDLPYWGESDGQPRNLVAPEQFAEAFSAAVDFLASKPSINRERIGVLGICGSGGFAISAAKIDPRLKAIATVSMYDMGAVTRNGLRRSQSLVQRKAMLAQAAALRHGEFATGERTFLNYLPVQLPADADPVTREFWAFYRTPRGIHIPKGRTLAQTQNRMLTSEVRFMNFYPFNDLDMIAPRPLLFVAGDQAHSREFSEDAYQRATGPKSLFWVPGAGHEDLYDRADLIPWGRLTSFFSEHLALDK